MDKKTPEICGNDFELEQLQCEPGEDLTKKYRSQLTSVVDEIVASCGEDGTVVHVDSALLPSKDEVSDITDALVKLIFPGYFGMQVVDWTSLPYNIGREVTTLYDRLSLQIARSIRHECRRTENSCSHCLDHGQEETLEFMKKVPELRRLIASDVQSAYRGDPAAKSYDEIVFCYPGLYAVTVYRLAHQLYCQRVPLLPRIMTEIAHNRTGIDIHPGATIGREFFIDHGTGVVIGETCEIGTNVTVYQGVTLGALSFDRDEAGDLVRDTKRHPTIEDNVVIYSGATILGGDTVIGNGCVIGGNVWLTRSVPANTKVLISSPELIYKQAGVEEPD